MGGMARFLAVAAVAAVASAASAGDYNGGRTVPAHRFVPVDRDGDPVSASGRLPSPVSQERTCGQCHEVDRMRGGSHFRTGGTNDVVNSVNREPWFLCSTNGSCRVVSVSDRGGLSAWEWVRHFGYAFPGGGIGASAEAMGEAAGDRQRWFVTGPLEMNCLACHSQDDYDVSEWAKQTMRENWGGAAMAAAGYARVEGMNARLDASWDPFVAENKDDHLFKVPQKMVYEASKFDDKGRCSFRVGKPRNENCLACHVAATVGEPSHKVFGDVHLQRGMRCVDCHSNGMDHRIETKSCASCHVEKGGSGPRPAHVGIPLVHFEKLSCTVCHSGSDPSAGTVQVRTMRANRVGIYGRAHWETDVPFIEEPFVRKNASGVVELCRRAAVDGSNCVYWAFAHDVRPARAARGADPDRCAACHDVRSGFFKGYESPVYFTALSLSFLGRPIFKAVLWAVFALLCVFAVAAAAFAVNRAAARVRASTTHFLWGAFKWLADAGIVASALYLAASGIAGWCLGGMTWWWLVLHMVAGGVLAGSVASVAALRHAERTATPLAAALWAAWLVCAACVVFTAVMPMMHVFGSDGQEFLLWSHRIVSVAFLLLSMLVCREATRRRRGR